MQVFFCVFFFFSQKCANYSRSTVAQEQLAKTNKAQLFFSFDKLEFPSKGPYVFQLWSVTQSFDRRLETSISFGPERVKLKGFFKTQSRQKEDKKKEG